MSNQSNTNMLERAVNMIEEWTGTQYADRIEADIDRNDMEQLYQDVALAEAESAREHYYAEDTY